MGASTVIKHIMLEKKITVKELAAKLGISAQSMSNKFYRDSFSYDEVVSIADMLNCDVKIIMRDSGKTF